MRTDEVVVQLPGSILPVPHPVAGLRVLLCSSQLLRTLSHSYMQGKKKQYGVWNSYPCAFCYLHMNRSSQVSKSLCFVHRFMLMEIAQCQHMKGGQALGNSMVISGLCGHIMTFIQIGFETLKSHKLLALQQSSILFCNSLRVVWSRETWKGRVDAKTQWVGGGWMIGKSFLARMWKGTMNAGFAWRHAPRWSCLIAVMQCASNAIGTGNYFSQFL
jgi:hypothetical protein